MRLLAAALHLVNQPAPALFDHGEDEMIVRFEIPESNIDFGDIGGSGGVG